MRGIIRTLVILALVGAVVGLTLTVTVFGPKPIEAAALPSHTADAAHGEVLFNAGGCLSCHKPSADSGHDTGIPSGGWLASPLGDFYAPNLTPDDETGLGGWSDADFVSAMTRGVSPGGSHYFPAFPYMSYQHAKIEDVLDIKAYLDTLEPVSRAKEANKVPFFIEWTRFTLGGWKWLAGYDPKPLEPVAGEPDDWNFGRYLVRGLGHCGECHTPRTLYMAMQESSYLEGNPNNPDPHCEGGVPSIHDLANKEKFGDASDFAFSIQLGFADFSSCEMGKVLENMAKLPDEELNAIATYLFSGKL